MKRERGYQRSFMSPAAQGTAAAARRAERQPIFRAADASAVSPPVRTGEILPAAQNEPVTGEVAAPAEAAAPVFGGVWPPASGAEEGFEARRELGEPLLARDTAVEPAAPADTGFDPLSWQPVFGGGPMFGGQPATRAADVLPEPVATPGVPQAAPAPEAGTERRITAEEEYDAFREAFPDQGQLQVQVFTARRTYPVEGAEVVVSKRFPDGEFVISRSTTDGSGKGALVALPAQPSALSEHPGDAHPYTTYDVRVTHPNYAPVTIRDVTVFEGVRSLQKVDLVPVAALPDGMTEIEYTVGAPEL